MQDLSIKGFRLSPQQKHLWQMQQGDSGQPYCACCSILIEGSCQPEILKKALQRSINRHEILRTDFQALQGMIIPLQVILDRVSVPVTDYDLSDLSLEEQDVKLQLLFREKSQRTFNFGSGISLIDISLVLLSPDRYVLILCLPALCADKLTFKNLLLEIGHDYEAFFLDQTLADEAQPLQYADLAEWQNELFEGEEAALGTEYWSKREDIISFAKHSFSCESSELFISGFKPEVFSLSFPVSQVTELEELARKNDVSIAILLQASWQVLLWRLTGNSDITIGTGCDGRNYEELESALGLLAKFLPIYCHLENKFNFSEILKQINEAVEESFKWQESFAWGQISDLDEDAPAISFFPVCFEFEEWPAKYSIADVSFSIAQQSVCFDKFKLKLSCVRNKDALLVDFHYDSGLFLLDAIERLAEQFQKLLESIIEKPQACIGQLEILSDRDRQKLLVEFNQTQTDYPQDQCIHQLFEAQVNSQPNQIAVVFEDQQLTYADLNARANQLAHYLQRLGVEPEVLVGIYVERSLDFIISLLGILKAGGAYIPLEPALPEEGIAFRLQDARVAVLLSQQQLAERLAEPRTPLVCLDSEWEIIAQESQANPSSQVTAENLAYVLFTSGSTGKPKGVAVEHQHLFNYVNAISEELNLSACTGFANVSTFAADLGNTTLFSSLCRGGCLHLVSQERASNPEALANYFQRYPVDCLKIVPSHLTALLTASHPEQILPQQRLILGGEVCRWDLIEQIQNYAPDCLIFNHYGPTETTVGVLTYLINGATPAVTSRRGETVPIGHPIANTQIYLLDAYLQPVPIGVPGELYISGAGVARGYLNRPDLTTERFVANPFGEVGGRKSEVGSQEIKDRSQESGVRKANNEQPITDNGQPILYKTGDLARYLPDGNIEFLGRIDHQVKIRGFRIELGEIEATLRQHPTVRETVVLAREDQPGSQRLVAYVVWENNEAQASSDLRQFLQKQLPEYMMPSTFVSLPQMPLTSNGKLDRQALPAPDMSRSEAMGTFVAPRTDVEVVLADIWAQVLRLERVSIHDNFFELGGDSILSIQIISRAYQAGLQLTPKQMFEHQTIAELADVAAANPIVQADQGLVTGEVPLTPIQHWFFEQNLSESHHWNQSILLEVRQALDSVLLQQTVQILLAHHDALRLRFERPATGWRQWVSHPDAKTPLTLFDLSTVAEADQSLAITTAAAELQASLDLAAGPLMRVAYFDLGANRSARLLWVVHHLAVDGGSWRILLEDFQRVYEQLSQGQTVQLPPKTTSFQYWATKLQAYGQSDVRQQVLDYWLQQARQPVASLPVDFPDGENTVASANVVSTVLSPADTQALLQEVPKAYQTQINDVLLTALVQAFADWTGESCLRVDLEGHGQEDLFEEVDLSRTVGWFTSLFPVLLDIGESDHPGTALKAIKEQLRSIPQRGISYGVLRYLHQEAVAWPPQSPAEVMFNYQGQTDQGFQTSSSLVAPAAESSGPGQSLQGSRSHQLSINGMVTGREFRLNWTYSEGIHQRATIETLAERCMAALRSLIAHCQSPEAGGYTPSDFKKANVTQKDLDQLLSQINRGS
ncbi:MAG: amino acid adenylation domain-containing protein [Leptolyngbya sp. SIO1E4]|nr:amino acid adenylation domain-containing protein [Leptolyngbya sp. SIO1E4]